MTPPSRRLRAALPAGLLLAVLAPLPFPTPLVAQGADRIWGRLETRGGDVHEGFIRWDRNEGSWVDILHGEKEIPREKLELWRELVRRDGARRERTIEIFDVRITWDDEELPGAVSSGIRFGHLRSLAVVEDDRVELGLRSGEVVGLAGGSTDLGDGNRGIVVDEPDGDRVELDWEELRRVDFGPAPPGVRPRGERLHGTVEDRRGERYTGYIAWDVDEVLETDLLDGQGEADGDEWEIPFGRIAAIEKRGDRSLVTLVDGEELELTGSNDVDDDNRGIHVSDPELGVVEVEWDEFASVRFHPPEAPTGYDAFDGGRRLRGTVVTDDGEELTGWVRWDADEERSWELLDGESRDIVFDIELGKVARIDRPTSRWARVTLRDGRSLTLRRSNDVDAGNRGIMVEVEDGEGGSGGRWILVSWDDFREARFGQDGGD